MQLGLLFDVTLDLLACEHFLILQINLKNQVGKILVLLYTYTKSSTVINNILTTMHGLLLQLYWTEPSFDMQEIQKHANFYNSQINRVLMHPKKRKI